MNKDLYNNYKGRYHSGELSLSDLNVFYTQIDTWLDSESSGIIADRVRVFKEWMIEVEEYDKKECGALFETLDANIEYRFHITNSDYFFEVLASALKQVVNPSDELTNRPSEPVYLLQMIRDAGANISQQKKERDALATLMREIRKGDQVRSTKQFEIPDKIQEMAIEIAITKISSQNKEKARSALNIYRDSRDMNPNYSPNKIFENKIEDRFGVSSSTFYEWLNKYNHALKTLGYAQDS